MTILRSIHHPVLNPVTTLPMATEALTQQVLYLLLGVNGTLTVLDNLSEGDPVIAAVETADTITLEITDDAVVDETDTAVTLEFGE